MFILSDKQKDILLEGLEAGKLGAKAPYETVHAAVLVWEKLIKENGFNLTKIQESLKQKGIKTELTDRARESLVGYWPVPLIGHNATMSRYDTLDTFLASSDTFRYSASASQGSSFPIFEDTDISGSHSTGGIRSYSTKATSVGLPTFLTVEKEKVKLRSVSWKTGEIEVLTNGDGNIVTEKKPFYGIELEVMPRRNAPEDIVKQIEKKMEGLVILKSDSSVEGRGVIGFEIVSVPATYAAHKQKWLKFFDEENGVSKYLKSWITNKCGIHIHISRNAFTKPHLARFVCFLNEAENIPFLSDIAGRNTNTWARFAPEMTYKQIISNEFSVPYGRRGATNLSNESTVEIRIFRGNTRQRGFFKCLEFVDAVYHYTKQSGMSYSKEKERLYLHYQGFLDWISKNRYDYSNLIDWLIEKEYITDSKRLHNQDKQQLEWRKECA